jgi:hypothetical protein
VNRKIHKTQPTRSRDQPIVEFCQSTVFPCRENPNGDRYEKNRAAEIIDEVSSSISNWLRFADEAGVPHDLAKDIKKSLPVN